MTQGSQQFTPSQILEAGRRAEAEGRIEYAIQFYRHLTDHLARTAEAAAARDALARLGASAGHAVGHGAGGMNGHYQNGAPASGPGPQAAPTGPAAHPAFNGMPMPGRSQAAPAGTGALVVRHNPAGSPGADAAARRKLLLPKSRRRYRTGRFIARAFTMLGFIEIVIGVLLIVAGLVGRTGGGIALLPEFLAAQSALGATAGIGVIVFGLMQVLCGQLARAIFDTASANRDLASFARARAAYDAGITEDQAQQQT